MFSALRKFRLDGRQMLPPAPLAVFCCAIFTAPLSIPTRVGAQELADVLWSTSDPPVVRSNHTGPVSLELVLAGDVPEVFFHPLYPGEPTDPQRWVRTTTRDYSGHIVSVFRKTIDEIRVHGDPWNWSGRDVELQNPWRYFYVPLGHVAHSRDFDAASTWRSANVQIPRLPLNLPPSRVHRINAEAQYSSHVVNLVVPSLADPLVANGWYDLGLVARKFYAYFGDDYQTIAVVPGFFAGFSVPSHHATVKNGIEGIGKPVMDDTREYGSDGRLRSLHYYNAPSYGADYVVLHETAHQWWDFWDWNGVTGIENVTDGIHGPRLMYPSPGRYDRIVRTENGWKCEPPPRSDWVRYLKNPMTRYKMGYIGPEDVPEMFVWEDQSRRCPQPGAPYRMVRINDFIARHGARRGPVEGASWRMATVVVTRDRLLSEEMMSAYNFIAARLAALTGYGQVPSFFEATDGRMRLHTHLQPKAGSRLEPPMPVDVMRFMPIDAAEIPGMRFDTPLATRIVVGTDVVVAGETTDVSSFESTGRICATWTRRSPLDYAQKESCGAFSRSGRFSFQWEPFLAGDVGVWSLRFSGFRELPVEVRFFDVTIANDVFATNGADLDRLVGGQRLYAGQFIHAGRAACSLEFRTDGDLVAYADGAPYWNAGTASMATGGYAVMQRDGDFVVYDATGVARWSTRTGGHPGAEVAIESDCSVVVRGPGGTRLWASDRNHAPQAVGTLEDRTLTLGGLPLVLDVAQAFSDPDGGVLTYSAISSSPGVAAAAVSGDAVTVTPVRPGSTTITVTATDDGGLSAMQRFAVTVAARTTFTDHPIVPGATPIRAIHITELRDRVGALRRRNGLPGFRWTDPALVAGVTPVRRVHLTELRSALNAVYDSAGRPRPTYADAEPGTAALSIKAAHIMELRAAVLDLE